MDALELHERLERDASSRVSELGALLARLSRAIEDDGDTGIARGLQHLGDSLKARPLDGRATRSIAELHERVLDLMAAHDDERAALMGALGQATARLEALAPPGELRRRLARFRESLNARPGPTPSRLVRALGELQEAALVPVPGAAPACADVAAPAPPARPAPAEARAAAAPSPLDMAAMARVLSSLLERVELPAEFRDRVGALSATIESELSEASLMDVLVAIRDLFDAALTAMRGEFQGFLDAVDRRLDVLLQGLGRVREAEAATADRGRELADGVQRRLSALRQEAADATALDQLKHSIESQLESLARSVDEVRGHGQTAWEGRDRQLRAMSERLRELETESREARRQLEAQRRLALSDALTGLPNRKALDEQLAQALARREDEARPLTVAIADIDHFKQVNDSHGHQAGDKALKLFASIVQKRIRQSDFCARYGGEEFVILFPNTDAGTASKVLEQVRGFVEQCALHHQGAEVRMTASFGAAEARDGDAAEALLARADGALYAAKQAGRNRVKLA